MKLTSVFLFLFMSLTVFGQKSFYDLKANDINGNEIDFSTFKGKKVLIVNTASKCGFTPQYKDLQMLHEQYGGDDFIIIGFPSNDFLKQEPGTENEIQSFCTKNYGVEFLMMSKVKVKGENKHPVYQWLTQKALNGKKNSRVKWNFQKYLISKDGKLVDVVPPMKKPTTKKIIRFIEAE